MKKISILFFMLCPLLYSQAQDKAYYGWIDRYEGYSNAFCLKFNNGQLVDTLYILDALTQSIPDPSPQNIADWKVWFKKVEPLKAKMVHFKIEGNTIRFTTAKCFYEEKQWFSFSFIGRISNKKIKGKMTEYSTAREVDIVNTENFQIVLSR